MIRKDVELFLGTTWFIDQVAVDRFWNPLDLTGGRVEFRLAGRTALAMSLFSPADIDIAPGSGGGYTVKLAADDARQAGLTAGVYTFEVDAVTAAGVVAVQRIGKATLLNTLRAVYPDGAAPDTTPAGFAFTAVTGATRATAYTSSPIVVAGINAPAAISIVGGSYSINGGAFVTTAGTVANGDAVAVRLTSSAAYSTAVSATLTIGGVAAAFSVTTLADPNAGSLTLDFTAGALPTGVTATGGVNGTRVDATGATIAATAPRFDYDALTHASRGILVETLDRNYLGFSEDFTNAIWTFDSSASGLTRTANAATGPSGATVANKVAFNSARPVNTTYLGQENTAATETHITSVYMKAAEYNFGIIAVGSFASGYWAGFNLSNGTVSSAPTAPQTTAGIVDVGGGWYRCWVATVWLNGSKWALFAPSPDGTLTTNGASGNGIYVWGAELRDGLTLRTYVPNSGSGAIARSADVISITAPSNVSMVRLAYDDDSASYMLTPAGPNSINPSIIKRPRVKSATAVPAYEGTIFHVLSYGQSLSVGVNSTPLQTTVQRFNSLRFFGGVRTQDASGPGETPYAYLMPLVEQFHDVAGNPCYETPCGGLTDFVQERLAAQGSAPSRHQMLASAPGEGSQTIAQLSKPSAFYTRFMNDVTNGQPAAAGYGKPGYKVLAFTWEQGQSDGGNATYQAQLEQLRSDIDADVKAITGQSEDVVCITAQIDTALAPALAQLAAHVANPKFRLATPTYHLPKIGDGVHFTGVSSKIFGAYCGNVYKRICVDGLTWEPVRPLSTSRSGVNVDATFNINGTTLAFDTTTVAAQANSGFTLVDNVGSAMTISSVTITSANTVRVTASATIPAGAKLRYAYAGLGNLRDNAGATLVFDGGGLNYPMHNWCVLFEQTLS